MKKSAVTVFLSHLSPVAAGRKDNPIRLPKSFTGNVFIRQRLLDGQDG
jgi:hypothetical protein